MTRIDDEIAALCMPRRRYITTRTRTRRRDQPTQPMPVLPTLAPIDERVVGQAWHTLASLRLRGYPGMHVHKRRKLTGAQPRVSAYWPLDATVEKLVVDSYLELPVYLRSDGNVVVPRSLVQTSPKHIDSAPTFIEVLGPGETGPHESSPSGRSAMKHRILEALISLAQG